ncbi:N-methyl-L-tryptophan oxidase [Candidatus Uabimicrobium sp. HlEnr_7]|uniref:N-methyl-L-tryptophan oxidase n=1 Tax=Candidatus Uabimicrobium helgolandensis TaxID=3095367 RepID=UPI003556117A
MASNHFDIVVVGAGALGTSCAYELAKHNHKVALFDQFSAPHHFGSSYGETRLFRQAYFEDERYIPFLKESYELWKIWETEFAVDLFHETGYLTFFDQESDIALKMTQNAKKWSISGAHYNNKQLKQKFPMFTINSSLRGYCEEHAGFLNVNLFLKSCLKQLISKGGKVFFNEKVCSWKKEQQGYQITTEKGNYSCDKIIFTVGAWLRNLTSLCEMKLTIRRGVQFWVDVPPLLPKKMPCFAFATNKDYVFGFPSFSKKGIKIASYHPSNTVDDLDKARESYTKEEWNAVRDLASQFFPWLPLTPDNFHVCIYTLTSDEDFILDYSKNDRNIILLGGGSGHAFKFSPFLAKQVSDFFICGKDIPQNLQFFTLR